jgi:putative hemolysin
MRSIVIAAAGGLLALLAGCSQAVVPPPPVPAQPSQSAAAPRSAARATLPQAEVASLPAAPPLETWVEKSRSDFQMTLDLNMQTELIELGVPVGDVDEDAAQSLAYMICSHLRAGGSATVNDEVRAAYPTATNIDAMGIVLAAQAYCLDTV